MQLKCDQWFAACESAFHHRCFNSIKKREYHHDIITEISIHRRL